MLGSGIPSFVNEAQYLRDCGSSFEAREDALTGRMSPEWQLAEHERHLEKLTLVCLALWSLLKEHTNLAEGDLLQRVEELEKPENNAGDALHQVTMCPKCQRPLSLKYHRCIYCDYVPPVSDLDVFHDAPVVPIAPTQP